MSEEEMLETLSEMIEEIIKEHRYEVDEKTKKRVTALRKAHYRLSHMTENSTDLWTIESVVKLEDLKK